MQMLSPRMGDENNMLNDTDKSTTAETEIVAEEMRLREKPTMYPGVRGVSGESWWRGR